MDMSEKKFEPMEFHSEAGSRAEKKNQNLVLYEQDSKLLRT